ncbi:MAG: SDR family oxidoreductase [Caulobacteraceae bacterium]|nr:SDR family oxidoreductase [Caulobacter sp.]
MPTVLIAGANRGIGLEFARQYAADGWRVIAGCRRPDEAAELQALAKDGKVEVHAIDTASDTEVASFKGAVGDTPLDLVIANAGVYGGDHQKLGDLDFEGMARTLEVNTLGPLRVAEAFAGNVEAAKGKLVAITSQMGSIEDNGSGGFIAYRASKAGLNAAWKSVALALKEKGVTAVVMHPGWVATDMGGKQAPTSPEQSVSGMREVIAGLGPDDAGTFRAFDGRTLPW